MLDDLNQFFTVTSNFRSPTSNDIVRQVILTDVLPELSAQTRSQRLKLAISKFISENASATSIPSCGA
jgi:hypothetical protein